MTVTVSGTAQEVIEVSIRFSSCAISSKLCIAGSYSRRDSQGGDYKNPYENLRPLRGGVRSNCAYLTSILTPFDHSQKANATVQCPVERGDYVVTQTVDLPKEIPPGWSIAQLTFECCLKISS